MTLTAIRRSPAVGNPGRLARVLRGERGQALVEFAMVVPLFLLMFCAIVDFGRAFYTWLVITNASREGARVGAARGDATAIQNRVDSSLGSLTTSRLTTSMTNVGGTRGSAVTVTLGYSFSYVTPIGSLTALFGSSISTPTISASSSMRLE